jgi:hypothetical protein
MTQRIQGMAVGFLAAILLMSAATAVIASTRTIQATYGINVVVDGVRQNFSEDMQPFTSEGRTFLPIRGIADALGLDVSWDGATSTVFVNSGVSHQSTLPPREDTVQTEPTTSYQLVADFLGQNMTSLFTGVASSWGEWGENLRLIRPGDRAWDSVPLNSVDEVPYILWHSNGAQPESSGFFDRHGNRITEAPYINDVWIAMNFQLFDLDNDGILEILIHWEQFVANGSYPFSLFRYIDGQYREMKLIESIDGDMESNWMHDLGSMLLGQSYRFYTDTYGRLVLYAASGGGGGVESVGFLTFYGEEARFEHIASWQDNPPPLFHTLTRIDSLPSIIIQ